MELSGNDLRREPLDQSEARDVGYWSFVETLAKALNARDIKTAQGSAWSAGLVIASGLAFERGNRPPDTIC
jgi:hypothetical protein